MTTIKPLVAVLKGSPVAPDHQVSQDEMLAEMQRMYGLFLEQRMMPQRFGVERIAHRGGLKVGVQNTTEMMTDSLSCFDAVETDFSVSSDDAVFCFHDVTVDALTDGTGTFTSLPAAYIRGLQFNELTGNYFRAYARIPYAGSFLKWAARKGVRIYPEMKNLRSINDVDIITNLVIAEGMAGNTVLQSGTMTHVERALNNSPLISCGFLVNTTDRASFIASIDTMANYPGRGWVIASFTSIDANRDLVQVALERGVDVAAWTINNPLYYDILVSLGVRHIMTDKPAFGGGRYA